MGLFSAIVKVAVDITTLPIAVAKDIVTFGGIATEQDKPYTAQRLDQIREDSEDADE